MINIPENFDWHIYLRFNPDLKDAGIYTEEKAKEHYLEHGHKEGREYVNPYNEIILFENQTIINAYHKNSSSGIGDFLRGSMYLAQICEQQNANFLMSFYHHPINKYITSKHSEIFDENIINDIYNITCQQYTTNYRLSELYHTLSKALYQNNTAYVCSMYSDLLRPDKQYENHRTNMHQIFESFILKNSISKLLRDNIIFNNQIERAYEDFKNEHSLDKYIVSHHRLGDRYMMQDRLQIKDSTILNQTNYKPYIVDFDELSFKAMHEQHSNDMPVILLSDNKQFKKHTKKLFKKYKNSKNILINHLDSNHCCQKPGLLCHHEKYINNITDQQLFNIAIDLKIMSKAEKIYSHSVYPWGSGFSFSIAKIYDIPLKIDMIGND
jgi:hypothetical protein